MKWVMALSAVLGIIAAFYVAARDEKRKHEAQLKNLQRRIARNELRDRARRERSEGDES